jgi:hypothetical protein
MLVIVNLLGNLRAVCNYFFAHAALFRCPGTRNPGHLGWLSERFSGTLGLFENIFKNFFNAKNTPRRDRQ